MQFCYHRLSSPLETLDPASLPGLGYAHGGLYVKELCTSVSKEKGARAVKLENREDRGSSLPHHGHNYSAVLKQEPTSLPKSHI